MITRRRVVITIAALALGAPLLSITDRNGLSQTLTYSDGSNSGPNGGFQVDANGNPTGSAVPPGLLIRVTDTMGRTLNFGYGTIYYFT